MIWKFTEEDIRTKIKLKLGYTNAISAQQYQALASVVSSALGGKKQKPKPPENIQQASAQLARIFGKK